MNILNYGDLVTYKSDPLEVIVFSQLLIHFNQNVLSSLNLLRLYFQK